MNFGHEEENLSQNSVLSILIKNFETQIVDLKEQNIKLETDFKDQIRKLENQNAQLQSEIKTQTAKLESKIDESQADKITIATLKKENDKLIKNISKLESEKTQLLLENTTLKTPPPGEIINREGSYGILQKFKTISNGIKIFSSGQADTHLAENILKDDKSLHCSTNAENSWIEIQFLRKKVALSGYLLRCYAGGAQLYLRNWILEGSTNGIQYTQSDKHSNETCLTNTYNDCVFSLKSCEAYSYFRFTMIGKSATNGHYHFVLSFVELFGVVFDQ